MILFWQIGWHDLAFYDHHLYESLRKLIVDSQSPNAEETFAVLDLTFSVDRSAEEGGGRVELVSGGTEMQVTPHNVKEYVRCYAENLLCRSVKKSLNAMHNGILDVIPARSLDGLTAEDLRLLLNGIGEINVQQLISYTSFNDETGGVWTLFYSPSTLR